MTEITDQWQALTNSPHLRAQAARILPVLTMVRGTATVQSLDEIIANIVVCIITLRTYPDVKTTVNCGGIQVTRVPLGDTAFGGATENYDVSVVASTVYSFRLLAETWHHPQPSEEPSCPQPSSAE